MYGKMLQTVDFAYELEYGLSPQAEIKQRSIRFRQLRAKLNKTPVNEWVAVKVTVSNPDYLRAGVDRVRNAAYCWASASRIEKRGLRIVTAREVISECEAFLYIVVTKNFSEIDDSQFKTKDGRMVQNVSVGSNGLHL